jgi:hypothetical protein
MAGVLEAVVRAAVQPGHQREPGTAQGRDLLVGVERGSTRANSRSAAARAVVSRWMTAYMHTSPAR